MKELSAFWGWALTSVSATYLLRPAVCKRILKMMEDPNFVVVSAWFSVVLGSFSLAFSTAPMESVVGGLFLFSGLFRLAFPERLSSVVKLFQERPAVPLLISLLSFFLGLYFLKSAYFGG
jgi:hypothetical protein